MEGSDSVRSGSKMTQFPFASTTEGFRKVRKVNLDEHTLKAIGKIVDKRVRSPSEVQEKTIEQGKKSEELIRAERKREAVVANINHYIKEKGLQRKEKDFNAKFHIFDKVNTFVDARQVFKEVAELTTKEKDNENNIKSFEETPNSPNMTSPFLKGGFSSAMNGFKNTLSPLNTPGKTRFFYENSIQSEMTPKGRFQNSPNSSYLNKTKELNPEELKALKIRELYMQLKKNAISKFGPEIFDNIQDKLNDPKCLQAIEVKRRKEINDLRTMKAEFGEFNTGEDLVEYLYNNERKSDNVNEELSNRFQNYLNKDLIENPYSQLNFHRTSSVPKLNFAEEINTNSPKLKPNQEDEINESSLKDPNNEPQIRLFHEVNDYKQKSGEVIKVLRKKIVQASKEKSHDKTQDNRSFVSSRAESRETSYMKFSPPNTPLKSPKERFTPFVNMPLIKQTPKTKARINKNLGKSIDFQNCARSTIGTFLGVNKVPQKQAANISGSSLPESPLTGMINKKGMRSVSQDKFVELCGQLDDASNSNKELNKEMRLSMKKMEDPYSKHFNVLKQFDVPESLLNPKPRDFFRSSSRIAINLAAQSLKSSQIEKV